VKTELAVAGQKTIHWLWLQTDEEKGVVFKGLTIPDAGTYEARCGNMTQSLRVER